MTKKDLEKQRKDRPKIEIIDTPPLKGFLRNTVEWTITVVAWAFWIYLILPLINLILWLVGGGIFYREVISNQGFEQFFYMFKTMGIYVLIAFIIIRGWGYYNYWMFGRRERRKWVQEVTIPELARMFEIPEEELKRFREMKEVEWGYRFAISRTGPDRR
jgi:poly-beta-1,6-N-acetyl-D-glucosamine biosynthesis protein PgaD